MADEVCDTQQSKFISWLLWFIIGKSPLNQSI